MHLDLLASPDPPSYADSAAEPAVRSKGAAASNGLHPRVAVVLGVNARWHVPLLICRALSTVPAAWWGLRCAFTFLGELLLSDGMSIKGKQTWTVEKRFRVTEVFLAILWVCRRASEGAVKAWLTNEIVLGVSLFVVFFHGLFNVEVV